MVPVSDGAAHIVIMIDIVLALVRPTPGLYIRGTIGDGDTSPGKMLDKYTLPTGACHDRGNRWPRCPMAPCNGRAAHIVIMIGIVLALVRPTPGLYIGGAIGDDDTSPSTMMGMCTLPTGARRKSHQACAIEKALMPTYAWFIYRWCHWRR
ncbi:hypothetical protein BZG14_09500 [Salinivibrio sp. IB282]|nr:hypothetical protein BZG14_09500 [Salinivibrio sp. IB282]